MNIYKEKAHALHVRYTELLQLHANQLNYRFEKELEALQALHPDEYAQAQHERHTQIDEKLHAFIQDHKDRLFIGYAELSNGLEQPPLLKPTTEPVVRFDVDTRLLSISSAALHKWCDARQLHPKAYIASMDMSMSNAVYIGSSSIALSYGHNRKMPVVKVEQFLLDGAHEFVAQYVV
jgi:hypothetical protein